MIMDFEVRDFGIDIQVARDKLAGFQSSDELAKFFQDEGVQGQVGLSTDCPIAVWMWGVTERVVSVTNTSLGDTYDNRICHNNVLRNFVYNFDRGYYPDLIK